jgi:hypothetical protein
MRSDTYQFRREDNDEIVNVDYETMLSQDIMGFLRLDDGVMAKRVHTSHRVKLRGHDRDNAQYRTHVSDSLGVGLHQVKEMEDDAKLHGFHGVEWKEDPTAGGFYQAHFDSPSEWGRYVKHRGLQDHNGITSANALGPGDFERHRLRVKNNPIRANKN